MNGNIWLQLLYKGVIVQTIITILVIASLCFMWTTGKAVPRDARDRVRPVGLLGWIHRRNRRLSQRESDHHHHRSRSELNTLR